MNTPMVWHGSRDREVSYIRLSIGRQLKPLNVHLPPSRVSCIQCICTCMHAWLPHPVPHTVYMYYLLCTCHVRSSWDTLVSGCLRRRGRVHGCKSVAMNFEQSKLYSSVFSGQKGDSVPLLKERCKLHSSGLRRSDIFPCPLSQPTGSKLY